jgi:hypothetical protein
MRKLTVGLALVALISSVTVAHARGGKTSSDDCQPGSADPDCPDAPPPKSKSAEALPAVLDHQFGIARGAPGAIVLSTWAPPGLGRRDGDVDPSGLWHEVRPRPAT